MSPPADSRTVAPMNADTVMMIALVAFAVVAVGLIGLMLRHFSVPTAE